MGAYLWISLLVFCYHRVAGRPNSEYCTPEEAEDMVQDCHNYLATLKTYDLDDSETTDCCIVLGTMACFRWRLSNCDYPELLKLVTLTNMYGKTEEGCAEQKLHCEDTPKYKEILSDIHSIIHSSDSLHRNDLLLLPGVHRKSKSENASSETEPEYTTIEEFHTGNSNVEETSLANGETNSTNLNETFKHSNCSGSDSNCSRQPKSFYEYVLPASSAGVITDNDNLYDPRVHAIDVSAMNWTGQSQTEQETRKGTNDSTVSHSDNSTKRQERELMFFFVEEVLNRTENTNSNSSHETVKEDSRNTSSSEETAKNKTNPDTHLETTNQNITDNTSHPRSERQFDSEVLDEDDSDEDDSGEDDSGSTSSNSTNQMLDSADSDNSTKNFNDIFVNGTEMSGSTNQSSVSDSSLQDLYWVEETVVIVEDSRDERTLSEPWNHPDNSTNNTTRVGFENSTMEMTKGRENSNQSSIRTHDMQPDYNSNINRTEDESGYETGKILPLGDTELNETREQRSLNETSAFTAENETLPSSRNDTQNNNGTLNSVPNEVTPEEGIWNFNVLELENTRGGRSLFLNDNSPSIELDRKDVEDLLYAASPFVSLMDTECSSKSQEELRQRLKQIISIICSNAKELCTRGRQPRQNDFSNWLATLMGTQSTTTDSSNTTDNSVTTTNLPSEESEMADANGTSNATKSPMLAALFPSGNPFGMDVASSSPKTADLTDPSILAILVNEMVRPQTTLAPNSSSDKHNDSDFIFNSCSRSWCLSSVIFFCVFILSC